MEFHVLVHARKRKANKLNMVPLFLLNYSGGGARRGTYASGSSGVGRRRGPRTAAGGQSGHSANSGDSLADDDEDA